ncbi:MAG: Smr/MutS family protein [Desulfurivibrionaceae bacterium]
MNEEEGFVEVPVDGILDLHTFQPKEIKELVPHYLETCHEKGIFEVRIIHGKGTGTLRRLVHSLLDKNDRVAGYRLAGHDSGSWGATLVDLKP